MLFPEAVWLKWLGLGGHSPPSPILARLWELLEDMFEPSDQPMTTSPRVRFLWIPDFCPGRSPPASQGIDSHHLFLLLRFYHNFPTQFLILMFWRDGRILEECFVCANSVQWQPGTYKVFPRLSQFNVGFRETFPHRERFVPSLVGLEGSEMELFFSLSLRLP